MRLFLHVVKQTVDIFCLLIKYQINSTTLGFWTRMRPVYGSKVFIDTSAVRWKFLMFAKTKINFLSKYYYLTCCSMFITRWPRFEILFHPGTESCIGWIPQKVEVITKILRRCQISSINSVGFITLSSIQDVAYFDLVFANF